MRGDVHHGLAAVLPAKIVVTMALKAKRQRFAALALYLGLVMLLYPVQVEAAGPAVEEAQNTNLSIGLGRDRIQWGEEVEVTVSAVNSTGTNLSGGIYVSFDDDALVLEVRGGSILRPGASAYNLAAAASKPITRPMVELWEDNWQAGTERRVALLVMPLARERLRVLARATFLNRGQPARIYISPTPYESRALDATAFPVNSAYVLISRQASLRRIFRRFERRIRELDDSDKGRFTVALAGMLEDPNAIKALTDDGTNELKQALQLVAPKMALQLRRDPLVALDNLRCLLVDLSCRSAHIYFGVPLSFYQELSADELARLDAKSRITDEKGGSELVALMEAEGLSYRRSKDGKIEVRLNGFLTVVDGDRTVVKELLDKLVPTLGAAAEKAHAEVNGLSFKGLQAQLNAGPSK
jgi:hypothetical protein